MNRIVRRAFVSQMLLALACVAVPSWALEKLPNGYYHTGDAVRVKKVLFARIDVFAIGHEMKQLPPTKSKQAVIDADVDKRFIWKTLRDLPDDKVKGALQEAYDMNGYHDAAKINQALGVFDHELPKGTFVTITYDAAKKTTTFAVQGGKSASVGGVDFMKGTWKIWFGKIDQEELGDQLISRI